MAKSKFKKFKKPLSKVEGFDAVVDGAAKPALWTGYATALGAIESLAKEGKSNKKAKKRRRQALKAVKKLAKHAAGKKALKARPLTKKSSTPNSDEIDTAAKIKTPAVARLIGMPDEQTNVVPLSASTQVSTETPGRAPGAVEGPFDGKGDDLQLIAGVGPKLEQTLHDLGIWHFEQIASWDSDAIAWVDEHLRFSGRIEREDWVAQAAALSRGGREEYIRVFGKEPR
ncbi:MAG: hypothetical protein AAGI92_12510 [Pseudomonadota bacterium]